MVDMFGKFVKLNNSKGLRIEALYLRSGALKFVLNGIASVFWGVFGFSLRLGPFLQVIFYR